MQQKIAALQDKRDWHTQLLADLDDEQKQISLTDPDTRCMPAAQGNVVGCNAQVDVDAKHKLSERLCENSENLILKNFVRL